MRTLFLAICLTLPARMAAGAPAPTYRLITGRVIGYTASLACLNGNADWSVLIRVKARKRDGSELIRLDFTLPCGESPDWARSGRTLRTFRLTRQKSCDQVLSGSVEGGKPPGTMKDIPLPIWSYASSTTEEALPFGKILPCYRSKDLPLLPVL